MTGSKIFRQWPISLDSCQLTVHLEGFTGEPTPSPARTLAMPNPHAPSVDLPEPNWPGKVSQGFQRRGYRPTQSWSGLSAPEFERRRFGAQQYKLPYKWHLRKASHSLRFSGRANNPDFWPSTVAWGGTAQSIAGISAQVTSSEGLAAKAAGNFALQSVTFAPRSLNHASLFSLCAP
jgi:hypothetical protein